MGRHKQRSMAELLNLALPLTTPRRTPILEGKARMQGPLSETDSMEICGESMKVCRNCRNSTEGTHMQSCVSCSKGYHTFCLEPSEDPNIQNRVLCYSCVAAVGPVARVNETHDSKFVGDSLQVSEETNAKQDDTVAERSDVAIQRAENIEEHSVTIDNTEAAELSLPDSKQRATSVQLSARKQTTRRKRLSNNSEEAGSSHQAGTINSITYDDELDRKIKKLKTVGTVDSSIKLAEVIPLCRSVNLGSNNGLITNERLSPELRERLKAEERPQQFKIETSTMKRSSDIVELLEQDDLICQRVVQEILTDIIGSSFFHIEKMKERIYEETGTSICVSTQNEEGINRTVKDAKKDEPSKLENRNLSIDLGAIPGEQLRTALKNLEREDIVDVEEGYGNNCTEVSVPVLTATEKVACSQGAKLDGKLATEPEYNISNINGIEKEDFELLNEVSNDIHKGRQPIEEKHNAKHGSGVEATNQKHTERVFSIQMQGCHSPLKESVPDKSECTSPSCEDYASQSPSEFVTQSSCVLNDTNAPFRVLEAQPPSEELVDSMLHQDVSILPMSESTLLLESSDCSPVEPSVNAQCSSPDNVKSNPSIAEISSVPVSSAVILNLKCEEKVHSVDIKMSALVTDDLIQQELGLLKQNTDLSNNFAVGPKDCLPIQDPSTELLADSGQSVEVRGNSNRQDMVLETTDSSTNPVSYSQNISLGDKPISEQQGSISSKKASTEDDVKVCDICGDLGYEEMLVVCSECNEGAEHVYCRQTLKDQVPEGNWLCEGCKIKQKAGGLRQSDVRTVHPSLAVSSSITSSKKQASFGNARLRLTARLEKRKLGPDRSNVLKGGPSAESPARRQAEDAAQASYKRRIEDIGLGPVAKKQLIETCGTSQVGSTIRPGISREGSFKNPESGKVKFLSPSELTGFTVTVQGNSPSQRTNSGRFGHGLNKSRSGFSSSIISDSTLGGGPGHKANTNSSSNAAISNSTPVLSPSLKNSLPKSSDTALINTNLKTCSVGAKAHMSPKMLKEVIETAIQSEESIAGGQPLGGSTKILTKVSSFKSLKRSGGGLGSEQKSVPDNLWNPRSQSIRPASSDMYFGIDETKVDFHSNTTSVTNTTELKAKFSPNIVCSSNNVDTIASSDGIADYKVNKSSIPRMTGVCTSHIVLPSNFVADWRVKASASIKPSNIPENSDSRLPNSVASHSENVGALQEEAALTPKVPSLENVLYLGTEGSEINQKQEITLLDECKIETQMLSNYVTAENNRIPTVLPSMSDAVPGLQGERRNPSDFAPFIVKSEVSNTMSVKGPGEYEQDAGNLGSRGDLVCEQRNPVCLEKSAIPEESRNKSMVMRPSWASSDFTGTTESTRCYKCKELGHSAQFCTNRSSLSVMQPSSSTIVPPVSASKGNMENTVVPSLKTNLVHTVCTKFLEPVVEVTTKESIPQCQKSNRSQIGVQRSQEDGHHTRTRLGVPTSLGPRGSQALNSPGLLLRETNDLSDNSDLAPLSGTSSGFTVEIPNDASVVVQGLLRPSMFNHGPTIGPTSSVTQMPIGNVARLGNPTVFKEAEERKSTVFQPGLASDLSQSIQSTRFSVSTPTGNLAAERSIATSLAVSNNGSSYWMCGVRIPPQPAATALSLPRPFAILPQPGTAAVSTLRPVPQRLSSQMEYLQSSVPESFYLWRGMFEVASKVNGLNLYNGVQAHPSNRAVPKVHEVTRKLKSPLHLEELPRGSEHNSWPAQFQNNPPSDENIALYFFAKDKESYEMSYKPLVDHILEHDSVLLGTVEDAEILIFSSNLLPLNSQRWNQFMFLWAVFRDKKSNISADLHLSKSLSRQASRSFTRPIQGMPSPPSSGRREELNIDVQGREEVQLMKVSGKIESSGKLHKSVHVAIPFLDSESKQTQPEVPSTAFQYSLEFMEKDNQSAVPTNVPVDCNLTIVSSIEVKHPASVPSQDEHGGFDIPPGFEPTTHKASLAKSAEEGDPCTGASTDVGYTDLQPLSTLDSTQIPTKKNCGQTEFPTNLPGICQSPPALVACPSLRETQVDVVSAFRKSFCSRSRSPRRYRDRERDRWCVRGYPYERGRDRERVDAGRIAYRERDRDRERRCKERERDWERQRERAKERLRERERERARERDWYRERERGHERKRHREKERGRERVVAREHGRRRNPQLPEKDYERESRYCRRYSRSDSRSRSPPYHRERSESPTHMKDRCYERYHTHRFSGSYSSSPESVHGSGRLHFSRQTESRDISEDSDSRKKKLSTGLSNYQGIGNNKMVKEKLSREKSVDVTIEHPPKDSDSASQIKERTKVSIEQSMPNTDLNVNLTEAVFNETHDLSSCPLGPCPPEEKSVHHTFLPERLTCLGQIEQGESSKVTAKVLANQSHASESMRIEKGRDFWPHGQGSCHQLFLSEFDEGTSSTKDYSSRQTMPNLDLALGGEGLNLNVGTELPLGMTLIQHWDHDDAVLKANAEFSDNIADSNLDLSLAFPDKMQLITGIDMNKPANEEPVNTSLCLYGQGM